MYYGAAGIATHLSTVVTAATATPPAGPYDLTTLTQVKAEPWYNASLSDAWHSRIITACSLALARYCNRVFPLQTYLDTIFLQRDPPISPVIGGAATLQLNYAPLVAATSVVTENGVALTLNTDYREDPSASQLIRIDARGYPMRWPKLALSVQYNAGYASGSPEMLDLADAALEFVKFRAMSATRDPGLKSQEIVGDYAASYLWGSGPGGPLDLPATVAGRVERYRIIPIV